MSQNITKIPLNLAENMAVPCRTVLKYPVVICGLGVLVAGDDLRSHPIGSTNEGVPSTDGLVQLSRHSKVNWNIKKQESLTSQTTAIMASL